MSDLKTLNSLTPKVLPIVGGGFISETETPLYTAAAGTEVQITNATLANNDAGPAKVFLSRVPAAGTAGGSNRIVPGVSIPGGDTLDLGEMLSFLGPGDFISAKVATGDASKIALNMSGVVGSSATVGALSGIQDDFFGSGALSLGSNSISGASNKIGTGANRYLLSWMAVAHHDWFDHTLYTTAPNLSCTDGAMTQLGVVDMGAAGGQITGSIHFFGRPSPTAGSTQAISGGAAKSGVTLDGIVVGSQSLTGVDSSIAPTVATSNGSNTQAALNISIATALNHRVFWAAALEAPPIRPSQPIKAFDGNAYGVALARWLVMASQIGIAGSLALTTQNALWHGGIALDFTPA